MPISSTQKHTIQNNWKIALEHLSCMKNFSHSIRKHHAKYAESGAIKVDNVPNTITPNLHLQQSTQSIIAVSQWICCEVPHRESGRPLGFLKEYLSTGLRTSLLVQCNILTLMLLIISHLKLYCVYEQRSQLVCVCAAIKTQIAFHFLRGSCVLMHKHDLICWAWISFMLFM